MRLTEYLEIIMKYCAGSATIPDFMRAFFNASTTNNLGDVLFDDDSIANKVFNGMRAFKKTADAIRGHLNSLGLKDYIDLESADSADMFMAAFGRKTGVIDDFKEAVFQQLALFVDTPDKEVANVIADVNLGVFDCEIANSIDVSQEQLSEYILYNEVGGYCQYRLEGKKCNTPLIRNKNDTHLHSNTAVVTILPNNFDSVFPDEYQQMQDDGWIDSNDFKAWQKSRGNKIVLCKSCANIYCDNTTHDDYKMLMETKHILSTESIVGKVQRECDVDDGIAEIIGALMYQSEDEIKKFEEQYKTLMDAVPKYNPKRITDKIPDEAANSALIRDIRRDVREHYCFIEETINRLKDVHTPDKKKRVPFIKIAAQV